MTSIKQKYINQEKAMKNSFLFSSFNEGLENSSQEDLEFLSYLITECTDNNSENRVNLAVRYLNKILDYIVSDDTDYFLSTTTQWLDLLIKPEDIDEIKKSDAFIKIIKTIFYEAKTNSGLEQIKDLMIDIFSKNWLEAKDYQYFIAKSVEGIYTTNEPQVLHDLMSYLMENKKVELSESDINKIPLIIILSEDITFIKFYEALKEKEKFPEELNMLNEFIQVFNPHYQEKFDSYLQEKWVLEYFLPKISLNAAKRLNVDSTEYKEKAFLYVAKEQKISENELKNLFFNQQTMKILDEMETNLENFNHLGKHVQTSFKSSLNNYLEIYNDIADNLSYEKIQTNMDDSLDTIKNKFHKMYLENMVEANQSSKKIKI
jgi:hypothetical protein